MKKRLVTRRTFLRTSAGAGVGAAAIGLVGCGDDDDDDEATATAAAAGAATAEPKRGGTIKTPSTPAIPPHFDPHTSSLTGSGAFGPLVYSTLLRLRVKDYLPEPQAAEKMPEQPDNLTFIFKLAPGIKFHAKDPVNGRAATAQDVVYSLERNRTPNNPTFINRSHLLSVDKIEAVDDRTVRLTTKEPDAVMLTVLALNTMVIVAPELVEKFGDLRQDATAIGTGPFTLEKFNRDTNIVWKANPNYFKKGLPRVDGAETLMLVDAYPRFQSGDLSWVSVPGPEVAGFPGRNPGIPIHGTGSYVTASGMIMNTTKPPLNDIRVRHALALLKDHKEHVTFQTDNHPERRMSINLGFDHAFWNISEEETQKLTYYSVADPPKNWAEGLKLLEAAGFNADNPLKIDNVIFNTLGRAGGSVETGDYVSQSYKKTSKGVVQMSLRVVDYATLLPVWAQGQFDTSDSAWQNGPDPDQAIRTNSHTNGGRNYGKGSDPELDRLIDKQRQTFDINERKKLINEAQRKIADLMGTLWHGYAPATVATQKNFHGFTGGSQDLWQLEEAWFS